MGTNLVFGKAYNSELYTKSNKLWILIAGVQIKFKSQYTMYILILCALMNPFVILFPSFHIHRAISNMIFVLFWPIFPFFLQVCVIFYWAASAVFLASVGPSQHSAVNRSSYTNADGEIVHWVEDLNSRVPCDPDVSEMIFLKNTAPWLIFLLRSYIKGFE